ncbi:hypothetical protein CALVIDRAFT_374324 [Calocera viscosa TUFC12733]|uniref:Uncharacterized protein n=1 Tax=Calocera viscosa (strain TUFC12733) TaxID=1330018 RepID=A0A167GSU2_CALVF|nr:hypothetical protein CALVIDRAFT_374324 [Calocera viscosa TUFC12733]
MQIGRPAPPSDLTNQAIPVPDISVIVDVVADVDQTGRFSFSLRSQSSLFFRFQAFLYYLVYSTGVLDDFPTLELWKCKLHCLLGDRTPRGRPALLHYPIATSVDAYRKNWLDISRTLKRISVAAECHCPRFPPSRSITSRRRGPGARGSMRRRIPPRKAARCSSRAHRHRPGVGGLQNTAGEGVQLTAPEIVEVLAVQVKVSVYRTASAYSLRNASCSVGVLSDTAQYS